MGYDRHLIVFHPVLNHPDTPEVVVRFIARHELTHIACPPRLVSGEREAHPPEFWEHEYSVAPERYACWHWINENLRGVRRETRRGFGVTRRWRSIETRPRTPYTPHLPLDAQRWEHSCPETGFCTALNSCSHRTGRLARCQRPAVQAPMWWRCSHTRVALSRASGNGLGMCPFR